MDAGLIYGAAIGDAIGLATQGMTPDECVFHYNSATLTFDDVIRDELRVRWRLGDWSDCFDQVVSVYPHTDAFHDHNSFNACHFAEV